MNRHPGVIFLALLTIFLALARAQAAPAQVAAIQFGFEGGVSGWSSAVQGTSARVAPVANLTHGLALETDFNGREAGICLKRTMEQAPLDLSHYTAARFDVLLPSRRAEMRAVLYLVDEDDFWYQSWRTITPQPGTWSSVEIDLRPESGQFRPMGHSRPWSGYVARDIREVGIRIFSDKPVTGEVCFDNINFVPGAAAQPAQALLNFETSSTTVPRYTKFETTFELARTYDNPFDPAQIDVSATFQSPSGRRITVPGFFYQEYERRRDKRVEYLIPVGSGKWKIRFSPTEPGDWSYVIRVKDTEELLLPPRHFTCAASERHGCLQVSSDPRYFEFEDGTFFYPIGHNIPAAFNEKAADVLGLNIEKREGTIAYDRFLAGMQRGRENYARIWLAAWSFGLEWSRKYDPAYRGVGRYNLQNGWRMDYVLDQAEQRGIFVQLALTTFGHFRSDPSEGDWPYSPYNVANGGWLKTPQQFWTDDRAQKSYQNMVRYAVARWGYSTNIAAWEMSNEVDLVTGWGEVKDNILDWHRRCVATIRQYDANPHMITTNFANWQKSPGLLKLPEISFSSTNNYQVQIIDAMRNQIFPLKTSYGKPALMAECGYDFKGAMPETTEKYLHLCLWSSYMIPFAGAGMSWWWDFIDDRDLYWMHKPLADFAEGEDLRNRKLQSSTARCLNGGADAAGLAAMALQNDTSAYFWIYEKGLLRFEADVAFTPQPRKGVEVAVSGLKDGDYGVEFWDTTKGGRLQELTATAKNGTLRFPALEFTGDIAGKIKPAAPAAGGTATAAPTAASN